ncbi:TRAP transporter small permease subunit [Marinobacter caseinilyticus]|uniref:TRAP transporter small permease subunit n=1 Tax=Marinobacter caseinilyticus TaxID=2692195 RepID=UPI001408FF3B|nr:TRAP transporter small permease subunit [Marinobacter caseinilyticus]
MKMCVKSLEWLVEHMGGLARLCVLALVLLVATNVILRYLFSIGPVSLQELEWHLVSPIALLGLSYSMKHRADVRIDFLYERFSLRMQAVVDMLSSLLTVAIGGVITWLAMFYVIQSYNLNEGSPDPGGLTFRYLLKAFLPLGFGLLLLQGLADCFRAFIQFRDPDNALPVAAQLTAEGAA